MSKQRLLIKTFGAKEGICNICGDYGFLTEDHSPPKSCVKPKAVQIRHIISLLADENIEEQGQIFQNGLKFKTLCGRCNNSLLGQIYDPALAQFTERVSGVLTSSRALPKTITISGNPAYIMRAVFGHLAALGVNRYKKGLDTENLKDAFLDIYKPFPAHTRFYYWPFPHRGCIVFRDAVYLDLPSNNTARIWLMKFYPISFLISWEQATNPMFNLPCLSNWQQSNPENEIDLPILLSGIPPRYWPEAPSDERRSVIMYGQEAIFTQPHVHKNGKTNS